MELILVTYSIVSTRVMQTPLGSLDIFLFLGLLTFHLVCACNNSPLYPNKNSTVLAINDDTYGTRNVSYWVTDNGLAVIDGDVIYGTVEDLLAHNLTANPPNITRRAHSIFRTANPWNGATITYKFDSDCTENAFGVGAIVNGAIANWKATAPYLTFKKVPNSGVGENGVLMIKAPSCGGCNSPIGFFNLPMTLNLQQMCPTSPGSCGVAEATHEFGHALGKLMLAHLSFPYLFRTGLFHEHQRFDREKFVHYNCENLDPACPAKTVMPAGKMCCSTGIPAGCCGNAANFNILSGPTFDAAGNYDIHSIMEYRANGFALPGKDTLTPVAPGIVIPVDNPSAIDSTDSTRICKIYKSICPRARACMAASCPSNCVPVPRCNKPGLCGNPGRAPPCCFPVTHTECAQKISACRARGCDFLR